MSFEIDKNVIYTVKESYKENADEVLVKILEVANLISDLEKLGVENIKFTWSGRLG